MASNMAHSFDGDRSVRARKAKLRGARARRLCLRFRIRLLALHMNDRQNVCNQEDHATSSHEVIRILPSYPLNEVMKSQQTQILVQKEGFVAALEREMQSRKEWEDFIQAERKRREGK